MEAGPKMQTGSRGVVKMVDDNDTTRGHSFFNDSLRSQNNSGVHGNHPLSHARYLDMSIFNSDKLD
jgi:hypothetical protein